jgi:hypothetical protein
MSPRRVRFGSIEASSVSFSEHVTNCFACRVPGGVCSFTTGVTGMYATRSIWCVCERPLHAYKVHNRVELQQPSSAVHLHGRQDQPFVEFRSLCGNWQTCVTIVREKLDLDKLLSSLSFKWCCLSVISFVQCVLLISLLGFSMLTHGRLNESQVILKLLVTSEESCV